MDPLRSEGRLKVRDCTWAYRVLGDPRQPPILFLHGFLGDGEEFDDTVARLADAFCCVTLDLPGHGATQVHGRASAYGMPSTAHALVELLERLGLGPAALVGYSMGGRLGLYLAVHFPERFRRAILLSASPGLATAEARQRRTEQDRQLAETLVADGLSAFLQQWYGQPLFASLKTHPGFARVLARRQQNDPLELARSLQHLGTGRQPSLWTHLTGLPIPLLLAVGGRDPKFVAINREMAEQCPSARLEILPHCGHALHLEDPAQLAGRIRSFLTEGDEARSRPDSS